MFKNDTIININNINKSDLKQICLTKTIILLNLLN